MTLANKLIDTIKSESITFKGDAETHTDGLVKRFTKFFSPKIIKTVDYDKKYGRASIVLDNDFSLDLTKLRNFIAEGSEVGDLSYTKDGIVITIYS